MTILLLAFLLITMAGPLSSTQNPEPGSSSPQKVSFCEAIRHPQEYDGKTVILTATYAESLELALFVDETCKKTNPEDDVVALATFSRANYKHGTPIDKKFSKFLNKSDSVRVTVVGLFIDGKKRIFGHLNCCRYKIEVQELLTVEQTKGRVARAVDPKMNSGALPSVLEGGAFDVVFF